jgi:DNA mismatch repair protein MutL
MASWNNNPDAPSPAASVVAAQQTAFDLSRSNSASRPLELSPVLMRTVTAPAAAGPTSTHRYDTTQPAAKNGDALEYGRTHSSTFTTSALQIHNRYLIAESDEGVMVIDQHALHERILYEHFKAKTLAGAVESQALLVPEPVDLSGPEAAAVLENQELLAQLGLKVEPFGGDTILISSYPAMMSANSPAELLRALVEILLCSGRAPERRDLLDELLHMMSCKAAIKAGDRLTPEEIDALLEQRHLAQDTHHCPHGRPTALVFTREELDRQFKRI